MSSYQTLPSNSCPDTRPDNVASNFIVDYENPINLDGQWEVALTEFNFQHKAMTLRTDMYIHYGIRKQVGDEKTTTMKIEVSPKGISFISGIKVFEPRIIDDFVEFKFSGDISETSSEIIFNSLEDAKELGFTTKTVKSAESIVTGENPIDIKVKKNYTLTIKWKSYLSEEGINYIEENVFHDSVDKLKTYLTKAFSDIFDEVVIKNGKFEFKVKDNCKFVKFQKDLAMVLGLNKDFYDIIYVTTSIVANSKPKLKLALSQMYIYTNIIEPIYVGGKPVPLLRCIWVDQKDRIAGDMQNVMIEYPMYLQVSTPCINKIEVNIRDDSGKLINFDYGSKTSLSLHFRKIN